ncbi:type II secretion system protein [Candidatus Parcubacteria bacterium]|nr:type II secretion system protein [Candidatus Parcubacteria bacterium]
MPRLLSFSKHRAIERAFTLVELLVVIAIIGVLATIVLVSLNTTRIRARDAKRASDLHQIQLALELFADSNAQRYPASDFYALNLCAGGIACGLASPDACGNRVCMNPLPHDPSGSSAKYWYSYAPAVDPTFFHLGANLEEAADSLDEDRDCIDTAGQPRSCPNGPFAVGSTPVAGVGIINAVSPETDVGGDRGCQDDPTVSGRYCYDITN